MPKRPLFTLAVLIAILSVAVWCQQQTSPKTTKTSSRSKLQYKGVKCTAEFKRFWYNHSGCAQKNASCQIQEMTIDEADKALIVQIHNQYRDEAARGAIKGKDGVSLPPAANMLNMVWDEKLAYMAQTWANTCPINESCVQCRMIDDYGVGQIVAFELCYNEYNQLVATQQYWGSVFSRIREEQASQLTPKIVANYTESHSYSHYSQVIWGVTWRVGCGFVVFLDVQYVYKKVYVCNYGPRGNIEGFPIYKPSNNTDGCGLCPVNACCGTNCSVNYKSLCTLLPNETTINHRRDYFKKEPYFYCQYSYDRNCTTKTNGKSKAQYHTAFGDGFIRVKVEDGETYNITFDQMLVPAGVKTACVTFIVRKGNDVFLKGMGSQMVDTIELVYKNGEEVPLSQGQLNGSLHFGRARVDLEFPAAKDKYLRVTLENPKGSPRQFFDLNELWAYDNVTCAEIGENPRKWSRIPLFGAQRKKNITAVKKEYQL